MKDYKVRTFTSFMACKETFISLRWKMPLMKTNQRVPPVRAKLTRYQSLAHILHVIEHVEWLVT